MKRNLLLFFAFLVSIILVVNSSKRILNLHTTSQQVKEAETKLLELKQENENFKKELEYKKGKEFAEEEIRNKLGLAREGETVVILPKKDEEQPFFAEASEGKQELNWQKWRDLFFGT